MTSLQPVETNSYFSRKKTLVTYVLSVLIFFIHCSTFYNYQGYPQWHQVLIGFLQFVSTRVAVPLFFIISGALFYRDYTPEKYPKKLKSRVFSLLIPYFCWNIIMMLFQLVTTVFFSRFFIGRVPFDPSWQGILSGLLHMKYNGPFWFVFALFVFAVFAPVIHLALRSKLTAFVTLAVLILLCQLGIGLPESLFHSRTCIVFYLAGGIVGRFYFDTFTKQAGKKAILAALAGLLLCWAYEFTLFFKSLSEHDLELLSTLVLLLYAASVWVLFDWVIPRVTVRRFTEHSFWVYAMHMNISALITKLLFLILPKHWIFALPNFLITLAVTLVVIELACVLLRRFLPQLYRLLSGAR